MPVPGLLAFLLATIPEPKIELFWSDPELLARTLPPGDRKAVEAEVESIYETIGVGVSFPDDRPAIDRESAPPSFHIILVSRSGEGFRVSGDAMGAILEKGPSTRTVFIFFPVVQRTMGEPVERKAKMQHDARKGRVFARALARVIAHEVAHAIDPEMPHGPKDSLMSARLTTGMLRQHRLSFDPETADRIHDALRRILGAAPSPNCLC